MTKRSGAGKLSLLILAGSIGSLAFLACQAYAADGTFTVGGNWFSDWPANAPQNPYGNYLFEAGSMRSNFAMIGCDLTRVDRLMDSAAAYGIRVALAGAKHLLAVQPDHDVSRADASLPRE